MTTPEPTPTAEHTDAVARVLYLALPDPDVHRWDHLDTLTRAHYRTLAAALLTTPAVHAAMLDALVRAGVLVRTTITANNATVSILAERIEVAP